MQHIDMIRILEEIEEDPMQYFLMEVFGVIDNSVKGPNRPSYINNNNSNEILVQIPEENKEKETLIVVQNTILKLDNNNLKDLKEYFNNNDTLEEKINSLLNEADLGTFIKQQIERLINYNELNNNKNLIVSINNEMNSIDNNFNLNNFSNEIL